MSHPPRRYWEDNYQARARDVPDPEAGGGMSAEGQTIREALDAICPRANAVDCDLPEHEKARAAHQALDALEARLAEVTEDCLNNQDDVVSLSKHLAEAERALREIGFMEEEGYSALQLANVARAALPSESGTP